MEFIYPFIIAFMLVFFAELGDKTQLLVLSFSTKDKARNILFGVALGTFFSHGLAILFGSKLGSFESSTFSFYADIFTYSSFLLFGVLGFICTNKDNDETSSKSSLLNKLNNIKLNYILIIALSIVIGEIGDKTFLASLGLGLQYPSSKFSLILGSITGMVLSNSFALFFGKFLGNKLKPCLVQFLSNIIFIIFGIIGFIHMILSTVL